MEKKQDGINAPRPVVRKKIPTPNEASSARQPTLLRIKRHIHRIRRHGRHTFRSAYAVSPYVRFLKNAALVIGSITVLSLAAIFAYLASIRIPTLADFENRKVVSSTRIYDRTGTILLYSTNENVRRTIVSVTEMGENMKKAIIAVEDKTFYSHSGISFEGTLRAVVANVLSGQKKQGGSTITQQVVKNTLLGNKKRIDRKIKEWVLAYKIEGKYTKDQILGIYLNEIGFGGNIYGIKEASEYYFSKDPRDLTIAEAAYLASLPKAPTHLSPYGPNKSALDDRKNVVLKLMLEQGQISKNEYTRAREENVAFKKQENITIKAPHFVFYIEEYLRNKYGFSALDDEGLKVVSTIDYELQKKAEAVVVRRAKENTAAFNGENAAVVGVVPATGEIVTMVGSRNYFDSEIDGKFNVATAKRQPGSSFKPFAYLAAFEKGFTDKTILYDLPTNFGDYEPKNFDDKFRGPLTARQCLQESRNICSVKMLYLAGLQNTLSLSQRLGIGGLGKAERYGLSLVLGGADVSLLDMTSAYSVIANGGDSVGTTGVLRIERANGDILEEWNPQKRSVVSRTAALTLSDVLSDNAARVPTFGANSALSFDGLSVAAKTGTTNSNRDAWTMGYSKNLALGVWVGNNNNSEMKKGGVALAGPIFNEVMRSSFVKYPPTPFEKPAAEPRGSLKPVLDGIWQGGEGVMVDKISGLKASEFTPYENQAWKVVTQVKDTLYWVDKDNPRGPKPANPWSDPQFSAWNAAVERWWGGRSGDYQNITESDIPTETDSRNLPENKPRVSLNLQNEGIVSRSGILSLFAEYSHAFPLTRADVYINGILVTSLSSNFSEININLNDVQSISQNNAVRVVIYDAAFNVGESTIAFSAQ